MDDIARRAGLSKGGVYAHFESKDEIFEALLRMSLRPPEVDVSVWQNGRSGREVITSLVEDLYRALARKDVIETLRLLIAEAPRVPDLVERWRADVIAEYEQRIGQVLNEGVRRKQLRRGIVSREVWLFVVPVLRPIFMQMLNDPRGTAAYLAHQRDAHIETMCELLLD
jgi:AcrR family transcriptional regulator